jgi:hypothetical protein
MSIPATAWNEASPAGSDNLSAGDNRIREMKTQIREVVDVDHKFDSSGQDADMGKHNQVSFIEAADIGSGAEGLPILGAQTVDGKAELVFTDEDDNEIQLTSGGYQKYGDVSAPSDLSNIMKYVYPVGSIYINATDDTNPEPLLGFGTWSAFGAGRVPVGFDSGDTDFDTAEETGGDKTHTLTTDEMPSHNHTAGGAAARVLQQNGSGNLEGTYSNAHTIQNLQAAGGGSAHNNLQPYIVVYMWKRTA